MTASQTLHYAEAPTQEENPEGPDQSPEVEEIPLPEPMDGIESQQPAPLRDGQNIIGHGDPIPSPSSVKEIPPGSLSKGPSRWLLSWTRQTPFLATAPILRR